MGVSEDKHVEESMDCTAQPVTSKANKFSRHFDRSTDTYSRGRGDELLLQLFWQLIQECLLPARNANAKVQRALSANEVFKSMDKKGSGQITGREFQQAVVDLGMPWILIPFPTSTVSLPQVTT